MKKILLSVAIIATSFTTIAQVGVGTTDPTAALEIKTTGTTSATKALMITAAVDTLVTVGDNGVFAIGRNPNITPTSKLTVINGQIKVSGYAYNPNIGLSRHDDGNKYNWKLIAASSSDVQKLHILDDKSGGSGYMLSFNGSTGHTGIGITSPTAKLHIGGTAGTDGIRFPDGTLQTTASKFTAGLSASQAVYTAGSIGLGTNDPKASLHIKGNTITPIQLETSSVDNAIGGLWRFAYVSGGLRLDANTGASGSEFGSNYNQTLFMHYGGNVSIGVSSGAPKAKLEIAGAIKIGASISTPVDGMIMYGDPDGAGAMTIGFYGYVSGAWVKLHL